MNLAKLSRDELVALVIENAGKIIAQESMSAVYVATIADHLYQLALHINKLDVRKRLH